jgi:hypothetical protein
VDVLSALKADPAGTAAIAKKISPWPNNSETYFKEVQDKVKTFAAGGQLGIFTNGYWGHPAYKLPPEVNLLGVAHYLEALDWQRDVIRLHTIFGGKNPHPNFLVGGMASAINLDDTATINAERLTDIRDMITRARRFVEQVYWPDLGHRGLHKNGGWRRHNYLASVSFPTATCATSIRCISRAESCSTRTWAGSCLTITSSSRNTSRARGTSTRKATTRDCIRGRARRSPNTPGRKRHGLTCRARRNTPG